MKRREFITLLGSAATWPLAARAQQPERMRRIGVLTGLAEIDPDAQSEISAFRQGLQRLGWTGRNARIVYRWGEGEVDRIRTIRERVDCTPTRCCFGRFHRRREGPDGRDPHRPDSVRASARSGR